MRHSKHWLAASLLGLALATSLGVSGCSPRVTEAIDSKDLKTSVRMSDSVFLEPTSPEKQTVWVRIRNSSDQPGLDPERIKSTIEKKLVSKGYKLEADATKANYRLDGNILFANLTSNSLTADMASLGGFGGALGGSDGNAKTMVLGGLAGAAIGAAIGSAVKVNTYALVVDLQVSERVEGGVKTKIDGNERSGGGTGNVNKTQTLNRDESFLHHRTRIAATAKQTNLKAEEAMPLLSEQLSSALANVF